MSMCNYFTRFGPGCYPGLSSYISTSSAMLTPVGFLFDSM